VLPNWASVKGARMDGASATISGKEFGKGGMEVVRNERGDDVLFTIWDDEEVAGTHGVEVVLPPGTGKDTRLGTSGTRSAFFSISVHCFGF